MSDKYDKVGTVVQPHYAPVEVAHSRVNSVECISIVQGEDIVLVHLDALKDFAALIGAQVDFFQPRTSTQQEIPGQLQFDLDLGDRV